ncbi:MAG: histidine kinase [Eubacteriales bacterium]|nr:histidine kinase [Eubacteriales bacterium]
MVGLLFSKLLVILGFIIFYERMPFLSSDMGVLTGLIFISLSLLGQFLNDHRQRLMALTCLIPLAFISPINVFYPFFACDFAYEFGRHHDLDRPVYAIALIALLFLPLEAIYLSLSSALLAYLFASFGRQLECSHCREDQLSKRLILSVEKNKVLQRTSETAEEMSRLEERDRISRELHDAIGHSLSSSILQLEALKIGSSSEAQHAALEKVQTRLSEGMDEIRRILHRMHREAFDLKTKVASFQAEMPGRRLDWQYRINTELPLGLRLDLLHIIKEGVSNFLKYSDADELRIRLLEQRAFYSLEIADDGAVRSEISGDGIGLFAMRDLCEQYGGYFRLNCEQGFSVFMTFPKGDRDEDRPR